MTCSKRPSQASFKDASTSLAVDWIDLESFSRPPPRGTSDCADPEASWGHRKYNLLRQTLMVPPTPPWTVAPPTDYAEPPVVPPTWSIEQTVRSWHTEGRSQRAIARDFNIDRCKVKHIVEAHLAA